MIVFRGMLLVLDLAWRFGTRPRATKAAIDLMKITERTTRDRRLDSAERGEVMKATWALVLAIRKRTDDDIG